jgi:crotonobetainyl-CoA:carnitine CoA-transferase CaiB-like acyl-CoA transferase
MAEPDTATAPLAGVRVLDLSRVLAGPWATQLLADLGADVLKVERPGVGDDTRGWGPPWFGGGEGAGDADGGREAAYFTCANRGKRSLAIDLASEAGAARVRALAVDCDVLVENFKLGDLARHGLDAATLTAANPRLIYCSISGFGGFGPYAGRPGYDFIIQAMAGLMSVTGEADGPPTKAGVALVDIMSGLYACNGVLAALQRRERTGRGGVVEVALFDVQAATLANQAANYLATGRDPARHGNAHPNIVPYQSFACADGQIALAVGADRQFRDLCRALGREDLAADPAYATNADRVGRRTVLVGALAAVFATRPLAHWLERLDAAGVPCGPVNTVSALFADPHFQARELTLATPCTGLAEVSTLACPIRLDGARLVAEGGLPRLGEHDGAPPWREVEAGA